MIKQEIEIKLIELFQRRIHLDFFVYPELKDVALLGTRIRLPARELVLILYDIEKEFCVSIPQEQVTSGNFDSFSNILESISSSLC